MEKPMEKPRQYAKVVWTASDVKTLRPDWSDERCEEELHDIERHLQDRLIELGWDVMGCLLPTD